MTDKMQAEFERVVGESWEDSPIHLRSLWEESWKSSREYIEVKLPDDGIEDCEAQWGERCRNTFDCGYNFASVQHEKAMQAAGLKVEG